MSDQLPSPVESNMQPPQERGHSVARVVAGVGVGATALVTATTLDAMPVPTNSAYEYQMPGNVTEFNQNSSIKIGDGITVTSQRLDPITGRSLVGAKEAVSNPYLDSCDTAKAPVMAALHEKWDGMLEAGESIKTSGSIDDIKLVLYGVSQKTGIPTYVLTENESQPFPLDGYEADDVAALKEFALRFVYGVMYLPPEMVKVAEINKFKLTEMIMENDDTTEAPWAGYYLAQGKTGGEIVMDTAYESVVVHEIMHALEDALCKAYPGWNDKNLGIMNTHPYVGFEEYKNLPEDLYLPNSAREYASAYGAVNEGEDSAEILTKIFYEEGLVQPGDPDFGSVYHFKQIYLMKRLEKFIPGTIGYANAQTNELRKIRPKHPYVKDDAAAKLATAATAQKTN